MNSMKLSESAPGRRCWRSGWRPGRLRCAGCRSSSRTARRSPPKKKHKKNKGSEWTSTVFCFSPWAPTMALSRTNAVSTYLISVVTSLLERAADDDDDEVLALEPKPKLELELELEAVEVERTLRYLFRPHSRMSVLEHISLTLLRASKMTCGCLLCRFWNTTTTT